MVSPEALAAQAKVGCAKGPTMTSLPSPAGSTGVHAFPTGHIPDLLCSCTWRRGGGTQVSEGHAEWVDEEYTEQPVVNAGLPHFFAPLDISDQVAPLFSGYGEPRSTVQQQNCSSLFMSLLLVTTPFP